MQKQRAQRHLVREVRADSDSHRLRQMNNTQELQPTRTMPISTHGKDVVGQLFIENNAENTVQYFANNAFQTSHAATNRSIRCGSWCGLTLSVLLCVFQEPTPERNFGAKRSESVVHRPIDLWKEGYSTLEKIDK